ncbi:MAG: D-alanyl-D-alanine carboxypeptidase, partial [Alphaproteobacteria bacterium]|nr:D-alanyl-D-alanine carboxypeptidase [Alphaproteobacteria bacterium]
MGISVLSASPGLAKYASVIMDAETGRVVHAVNANTRNYPASLTKMMTLYMVFAALEDGRLSMDQRLKVSARAARQPSSKLGLRKGQTITVKQAILAMVTKSANDVAATVAEALSGSERNFALTMTATARRLGMDRTIFRNASGLPHRGQQSTARDMAVLARALITDFPRHYHFFSTRTFTFGGIRHRNHNKMIATYDGADGIKTGYIRASGFNLVASAKRGDRRLIGVVFGGRSARGRDRHMATLLDKGFRVLDGTPTETAAADAGTRK